MVISQAASSDAKRKVFTALAETYQKLAGEMEKIAAAHAILDEEREKNLLGLLGGSSNPSESLAEIAKVLAGASSND